MDFKELEDIVLTRSQKYSKEYNICIDESFAVHKLYEEVGEFAQAILIHHKKSRPEKHLPHEESKAQLGKELADIIGMCMINANLLGIDLEEAILKKWGKY